MAGEKEKQALDHLFGNKTIAPEEKVQEVAAIWEKLDVPDSARNEIKQNHQRAVTCLDMLDVSHRYTNELRRFANELIERTY